MTEVDRTAGEYALQIYRQNQPVFAGRITGPLELGRQQQPDSTLYRMQSRRAGARIDLAPLNETRIGRRQLLIEPHPNGALELTNLSNTVAVDIARQSRLEPASVEVVQPPLSILLPGNVTVSIGGDLAADHVHSLNQDTLIPGSRSEELGPITRERTHWQATPESEQLVQALQTIMDVFQSSLSAEKFFSIAIRGAVELVKFDRAQVLLFQEGNWSSAQTSAAAGDGKQFSQTVLSRVAEAKRTFWESSADSAAEPVSLIEVEAVIAAPILSPQGTLIGALYCDRRQRSLAPGREITRLDARLIELLACGVASGLARIHQEETAQRLRHQFEQFFTPELAQELENHPDLLEGRDADVTILFCDIRGFSRISERIGARTTFEWMNDVMGILSECVTQRQGVIVDYIGDELMAMWGAPKPQDHAPLACQAALDMLRTLPEINQRWQEKVGEAIDLGVGLNSGPVRAGNSGSKQKFKYGPLGNTVNLASRVQGATKHLKSRVLVTGDTADQLDTTIFRRRIAEVQFVNIQQAVPVWELSPVAGDQLQPLYASYHQALAAYEQKQFHQAAQTLSTILSSWPDDGPALMLLQRTVSALVDGADPQHPVWTLQSK